MASDFRDDNIKYNQNLKTSTPVTRGTVLASNGSNFELVTPTSSNQILTSDNGQSSGVAWSVGPQGIGTGFGIGSGITPTSGNTEYFLMQTSASFVPALPIFSSVIVFFSTRPGFGGGWTNDPTVITGGSLDFTFGFIDSNDAPTTGNFTPYPGGPHFQIMGTSINTAPTSFSSFTTTLSVPVSNGDQISIRLVNNLTFSGPQPTAYSNQNAALLLRF